LAALLVGVLGDERYAIGRGVEGVLDGHPRFTVHHTPTYASWINQVERWFACLIPYFAESQH
jgi:hypothetical protein